MTNNWVKFADWVEMQIQQAIQDLDQSMQAEPYDLKEQWRTYARQIALDRVAALYRGYYAAEERRLTGARLQ